MNSFEDLVTWVSTGGSHDQCQELAGAALQQFMPRVANRRQISDLPGEVGRFRNLLDERILRLSEPLSELFAHERGLEALRAVYGPNALPVACAIVRSGMEGGFVGILHAVAEHKAKEYAKAEVRNKVLGFWNCLSAERKLELGREFIERWGHLLPSELTEGIGVRILEKLPEALIKLGEHAISLRRVVR